MNKIFFNYSLFIAIACGVCIASCKKDKIEDTIPTEQNNDDDTSSTSVLGIERWQYGSKAFDVEFTKESGVIKSFTLPEVANVTYSFTHDGSKIIGIEQVISGGATTNYVMNYDGDKLLSVTGGSYDYSFEFDVNDKDRVVQLNKGTQTFYEFTYTGNNITTIKKTQGLSVTDYVVEYDNKPNPFYNDMNVRAFTIGYVYNQAPHNWALDYMLTLTENNPTKFTFDSKTWANDYFWSGTKLDSIVHTWSTSPSNPSTYVLTY